MVKCWFNRNNFVLKNKKWLENIYTPTSYSTKKNIVVQVRFN